MLYPVAPSRIKIKERYGGADEPLRNFEEEDEEKERGRRSDAWVSLCVKVRKRKAEELATATEGCGRLCPCARFPWARAATKLTVLGERNVLALLGGFAAAALSRSCL